MNGYYGDFPVNATLYMTWDSFAAATGAPSAASNFAAADVLIYKNGSNTQRTSANGITVTTTFDTLTGLQMVAIDLSDNTDAGFYAAGNEYQVAISDVTIDSQTVRFWLGSFSIERANGDLALLKSSTFGLSALKTLIDTIDDFLDTEVAAIKAKTDNLPSDPADASDIASSFTTVNSKLDTIDDFLDTEVAAIKAKTDNLPASPAAAGDAMALTSAAVDAVLDEVVEGSTTMRQLLRGFAAALLAKSSGLNTATAIYRDIGDSKDRITATTDAFGNRSAVTTDLT